MKDSFQTKYVPFLSLGHFREPFTVRESHFHDLLTLDYSKIVYVSLGCLKEKIKFRLMGVTPPQCGNKDEYSRVQLKKYKDKHKEIRFNYGLYYNIDSLLLVDDIIEYNHHRREFKDIRTARQINEAFLR